MIRIARPSLAAGVLLFVAAGFSTARTTAVLNEPAYRAGAFLGAVLLVGAFFDRRRTARLRIPTAVYVATYAVARMLPLVEAQALWMLWLFVAVSLPSWILVGVDD